MAAMCCMVAMATQAKEVTFNVYYNEIIKVRGELYLYSERYLGTTDVILDDSRSFELDQIKLVTPTPPTTPTSTPTATTSWKSTERTSVKTQMPLSEETLMATNMAKKAESVAKQIYRIRETRMNILSGDVEHMPADGEAMKLVLEELNKQEKALTSMFVGKSIVKTHRKSVTINVNDSDKIIQIPLLKFSKEQGPLDSDDKQGDIVTLIITRKTQPVLAAQQPKKGGPVYEDQIISSKAKITYQNKIIYEKICNH